MKKILFVFILLVFALSMAAAQINEFSLGEWNDNIYTNDFLGIKFQLPEDWKRFSDEDLAQVMNLGTELLNDDQKKLAELSKINSVSYMGANNPATGDSIMVSSVKSIFDLTAEYFMNGVKTQLQALESIDYEVSEISKEELAGREYYVLTAKSEISGINLIQKFYVYKIDKYFLEIVATTLRGEDAITEMMNAFE
ncbi:MAG: hypothetical protein J6Y75_06530 [Spirochaetaceae bacterium]|nr:hypothetical protein [Spirochaetaceae bacterium]